MFLAPQRENATESNTSIFSGISNMFSGGGVTNLNDSFNTTVAWGIFQDYLMAAKEHDVEKLGTLSYKLSPTCANPETLKECETLMDSVYLIARDFKLGDFKNVAYDEKQIIMSTEYMEIPESETPVKVVLYFIKVTNEPKVLGIRFCYGADDAEFKCVVTDPEKRDSDKDGWWDDTEVLMNK